MKRLERRFALGIALSVVAHVLLIAYLKMPPVDVGAQSAATGPMVVQLAPPKTPKTESPERPSEPEPATPPRVRPPKAPIIAVPREVPKTQTPIPVQPPPPPEPVRQEPPPTMSFSDLVNARRASRAPTVSEAAEARARSAGDPRDSSISRNLQTLMQREGTSGVFEILNKGPRYASFSFKGWKATNDRDSWKQTIEVDAGRGGDVDLAIVRRMIQLIRGYYDGDFNWDSRRLGRVQTLSARQKDYA
jgi:hypothetical protein